MNRPDKQHGDDHPDHGLDVLDRLEGEFARVAHAGSVARPWWRRLGGAWLLSLVTALGV